MKAEDVLQWTVPDPAACRAAAGVLREEHAGLTDAQLAWLAVKSAKRWAALAGAAAGAVANPLAMLPASAAEIAWVLRAEGKMAGVVAALLDPESLDNPDAFHADVLAVVFPGAVSQAAQQVGVRGTQFTTKALLRTLYSKGLLAEILRIIARALGLKITRKGLISKSLPIVGGGIGAAWNWVEVQAVGRRAIRYHQGK